LGEEVVVGGGKAKKRAHGNRTDRADLVIIVSVFKKQGKGVKNGKGNKGKGGKIFGEVTQRFPG